jgi:hypothetical protein
MFPALGRNGDHRIEAEALDAWLHPTTGPTHEGGSDAT